MRKFTKEITVLLTSAVLGTMSCGCTKSDTATAGVMINSFTASEDTVKEETGMMIDSDEDLYPLTGEIVPDNLH